MGCVSYTAFPAHIQVDSGLQDYLKALTQQPLNPLPSYLDPRNCKKFAPPILRYGWAIDEGAIMKFAEEHDLVLVCGPDNTPNVEDTISDPAIILAIVEHLGIHDTGHMGFEAAFENGDYIYIFVVGTNYTSFPIEEEQAKLKEFFGGAPGRWFLDLEEWQWKRFAKAPPCKLLPLLSVVCFSNFNFNSVTHHCKLAPDHYNPLPTSTVRSYTSGGTCTCIPVGSAFAFP